MTTHERRLRRIERKLDALIRHAGVEDDQLNMMELEIMGTWADVKAEIADEQTVNAGLSKALDHIDDVLQELRDKHPDGPTPEEMDAALADMRNNKQEVIDAVTRGTAAEAEPTPPISSMGGDTGPTPTASKKSK